MAAIGSRSSAPGLRNSVRPTVSTKRVYREFEISQRGGDVHAEERARTRDSGERSHIAAPKELTAAHVVWPPEAFVPSSSSKSWLSLW